MLNRPAVTAVAMLVAAPVLPVATAQPAEAVATRAADGRPRSAPVRGWSVPLDRRAARPAGQVVTPRHSFETVGVTWRRGEDPLVEIRTRAKGGGWSPWQEVHPLIGGAENATEPVWVGPADGVRVRVDEWRRGLDVVLVHPGDDPHPLRTQKASARLPSAAMSTLQLVAAGAPTRVATAVAATATDLTHAPRPKLRKRKAWGAVERWRSGRPVRLRRIRQAHVHHTAGSNNYSRAEVPGIIRGMYWYHTKKLGWSDIGYNFLVDRFGRIWVGRAGGPGRRVRGAHTLGFNHASFGVASIGNHENDYIGKRRKTALVRLIAWLIDRDRGRPAGRVRIKSHGSDRFRAGRFVRLPVVDGHRDTNYTACPGHHLYKRLGILRHRAQKRANEFN